jgi:hypothetical protein
VVRMNGVMSGQLSDVKTSEYEASNLQLIGCPRRAGAGAAL